MPCTEMNVVSKPPWKFCFWALMVPVLVCLLQSVNSPTSSLGQKSKNLMLQKSPEASPQQDVNLAEPKSLFSISKLKMNIFRKCTLMHSFHAFHFKPQQMSFLHRGQHSRFSVRTFSSRITNTSKVPRITFLSKVPRN